LKIAAKQIKGKELQAHLFSHQGLVVKMLGSFDFALQSFRKSDGIASNLKHALQAHERIGPLRALVE
jgi:hypothetical protein